MGHRIYSDSCLLQHVQTSQLPKKIFENCSRTSRNPHRKHPYKCYRLLLQEVSKTLSLIKLLADMNETEDNALKIKIIDEGKKPMSIGGTDENDILIDISDDNSPSQAIQQTQLYIIRTNEQIERFQGTLKLLLIIIITL
jgi:hypothetical protein